MRTTGRLEKLLEELHELERLKSRKWFQRPIQFWFSMESINDRIKEVKSQCFRLVDKQLLSSDKEYSALAKENLRLIAAERAYFKVTATTMAVLHSHSTRFKGNVAENGYAYCYADQGNFPLNPVAEYMFPSRIEGKVDHWGNLHLKAVATGFGFIQTLPKDYKGVIGSDGSIKLSVNETESDFLSGGRLMIDKMMANLFGTDESLKRKFALNRGKMRDKVNQFSENH